MSCGFEARVAALASGAADDELTAHLPGCDVCRAELEAARALLRQLAPLGRPEAPEGELFFADFTRGVRAQLEAAPAGPRRRSWLAAPALCAAATLVWMLAGRALTQPIAGEPVAPATAVASADPPGADDDALDDLLPDVAPDPTGRVAELDDAQLDAVLARLSTDHDGADDDASDPDPFDALDAVPDDQLDAIDATFTL